MAGDAGGVTTLAPSAASRSRLRLRDIGPGAVIAAAFIGPGTVTTATLAGARYGYALLWAVGFSMIATLLLQVMGARLGLVTGTALGLALRPRVAGVQRMLAGGLVVCADLSGFAACVNGNRR